MALGDLERYRATYSDHGSDSTAEALYLRALRARSSSGRASKTVYVTLKTEYITP